MLSRRFSLSFDNADTPQTTSAAFVAFPIVGPSGGCFARDEALMQIYRIAYEQARELHKPSRWAPLYQVCSN
jgi:hypothetical protein